MTLLGPTPEYTFGQPGMYKVTLRAHDAKGNAGVADLNVTVRDTVSPVAVVGKNRKIDPGQLVTLDGTDSHDNVGVAEWHWTIDSKKLHFEEEGDLVNFVFTEKGRYNVTLYAIDAAGNIGQASFKVEVGIEEDSGIPGYSLVMIIAALSIATIARYRSTSGLRRQ